MKHYYTSRATLFQKIYSFVAEANPISDIIDYYFIMNFKKKSGKNKNKLRTIYHSPDSCQQKSVNSQELLIYPSFGKFWRFFRLFVLTFCQSKKLLAEVVPFSYP